MLVGIWSNRAQNNHYSDEKTTGRVETFRVKKHWYTLYMLECYDTDDRESIFIR